MYMNSWHPAGCHASYTSVVCHYKTEKNPPHILAHLVFANAQIPSKKTKRAKISFHHIRLFNRFSLS